VLLVAAVSLGLGLALVGRVGLLASLVNFGALFAFLMLHLSVVSHFIVHGRQRSYGTHLVVPVTGFAITAYVLYRADVHARIAGVCWLALGTAILAVRRLTGRPTGLRPDA
jgi:hypothetical protein